MYFQIYVAWNLKSKTISFWEKKIAKLKDMNCLFTNFQTRFDWIYKWLRRNKKSISLKKTIVFEYIMIGFSLSFLLNDLSQT